MPCEGYDLASEGLESFDDNGAWVTSQGLVLAPGGGDLSLIQLVLFVRPFEAECILKHMSTYIHLSIYLTQIWI